MELADLMHTEVLSVNPDTTMAEAARRMVERDTGAAVVLEDGELVGMVSERDLMRDRLATASIRRCPSPSA
jgi:CBS domain-containing protein